MTLHKCFFSAYHIAHCCRPQYNELSSLNPLMLLIRRNANNFFKTARAKCDNGAELIAHRCASASHPCVTSFHSMCRPITCFVSHIRVLQGVVCRDKTGMITTWCVLCHSQGTLVMTKQLLLMSGLAIAANRKWKKVLWTIVSRNNVINKHWSANVLFATTLCCTKLFLWFL